MSAVDGFTWLYHPEAGGYFNCPDGAVTDWLGLGWEHAEAPPPEPNPVVAERIAWERGQERLREEREAAEREAAKEKTDKPKAERPSKGHEGADN